MTRLLLCLCATVMVVGTVSDSAEAARGDLLATYQVFGDLQLDAASHRVYVSDSTQNIITVIDTRTLSVIASVSCGDRTAPRAMALSVDGTRLYVALSGSAQIGVMDVSTLSMLHPVNIPYFPSDIVVGLDGRMYATSADTYYRRVIQIDIATGACISATDDINTYDGDCLDISPDRRTLYYGMQGISPSQLAQIDVSTPTASVIWTSPHSYYTSGHDLVISHSGDAVYFVSANGGVAKRQTSDMAVVGTLSTGSYPGALALSPDDKVAYVSHTSAHIDMFDTTSCTSIGSFSFAGEPYRLLVDETGSRLFASSSDSHLGPYVLRVYDTGFAPVPEPPALVGLAAGLSCVAASRRRRIRRS